MNSKSKVLNEVIASSSHGNIILWEVLKNISLCAQTVLGRLRSLSCVTFY